MSRVFVSKSETLCRRSLLNPTSFRQQQQSIGSRYLLATTNNAPSSSSSSFEQPQKRWMGHTVRLIAMEDLPHGKVRNYFNGDRLVAKVSSQGNIFCHIFLFCELNNYFLAFSVIYFYFAN